MHAEQGPTIDEGGDEEKGPVATWGELYKFASSFERLLLFFAALAAVGAGASVPMMIIAMGNAFDQLGSSETLPGQSVLGDNMNSMLRNFAWVALGMGGGKLIYISIGQYVCASQVLKYRLEFLRAVLRQDVAWYDSSKPEELTTKFESSMVKVQKGLSSQAMMFWEGLGYGMGSLIMGFVYQPVVSGITLAAVPLLIGPAGVIMHIVEKGGEIVTKAYGQAGGIATEALFSMRTVVSLGIEDQFQKRYSDALAGARKATVRNQTVFGVSVGCAISAYLVMMAVAIIYGAFMLANETEDSFFDFVVPNAQDSTTGPTYTHFCADSSNTPTGNITSAANTKVCLPPSVPFQMSCLTAAAMVQVGIGNFGFESEEKFRSYVQDKGPRDYLDDNEKYYDCTLKSVNVLIAILCIMSAGEGFSMTAQVSPAPPTPLHEDVLYLNAYR
jgi:ABC-type multidrug transport system fused ATPase/permease subunit